MLKKTIQPSIKLGAGEAGTGLTLQEVRQAYEDKQVERSLLNADWLTAEYVEEVLISEEMPERGAGLGARFEDDALQEFFIQLYKTREPMFRGLLSYLTQRMTTRDGACLPIERISFADDQFLTYIETLGVERNHEFDRSMIGKIPAIAACLVAPEKIRKQVVRVVFDRGEPSGDQATKEREELWQLEMLLAAELIRRGAKEYLERRPPDTR